MTASSSLQRTNERITRWTLIRWTAALGAYRNVGGKPSAVIEKLRTALYSRSGLAFSEANGEN